jgi:hypothetical protein
MCAPFHDAEAIAEAGQRQTMKFAAAWKSARLAPHRVRERLGQAWHHQSDSCRPVGTQDCGAPGDFCLPEW